MSKEVPLPTFDVNGTRRVFCLANDDHRRFLTGGLPPPEMTDTGRMVCPYCADRVQVVTIVTHVPGSEPVRALAPHRCQPKATV